MSVSREEFEALVTRVESLESLSERTWSIIGHLDTSIRTMTQRFDQVDERFNSIDRKLDEIIERLT